MNVFRDHIISEKPNSASCSREVPCVDCLKVMAHFEFSGEDLWHSWTLKSVKPAECVYCNRERKPTNRTGQWLKAYGYTGQEYCQLCSKSVKRCTVSLQFGDSCASNTPELQPQTSSICARTAQGAAAKLRALCVPPSWQASCQVFRQRSHRSARQPEATRCWRTRQSGHMYLPDMQHYIFGCS